MKPLAYVRRNLLCVAERVITTRGQFSTETAQYLHVDWFKLCCLALACRLAPAGMKRMNLTDYELYSHLLFHGVS